LVHFVEIILQGHGVYKKVFLTRYMSGSG